MKFGKERRERVRVRTACGTMVAWWNGVLYVFIAVAVLVVIRGCSVFGCGYCLRRRGVRNTRHKVAATTLLIRFSKIVVMTMRYAAFGRS